MMPFTPRRAALAVASLALLAATARAQSADPAPPLSAPIPVDSAVIIDTLPNGLRYYIRVNHKPEQRAELRLVVNAGSILEDSAQRGVAHFVEHMAFNGTTHFQRQQLVSYLESTGVRFGADLNAATSFDETVYQLTVPTDSARLLETGVQILEDWAHGVTFDSAEVDRERGVVIEEWRLGRGAAQRVRDKQFPVLFAGSRYARRIPIGDRATLEHVRRDQLLRFYHDWYRPDLMAVVAVGDFDAKRVEQLIRSHFASLAPPPHPRQRELYSVPDTDSTLVSVVTDPENTSSGVAVYYKQPVRDERTVGDYRERLVEGLYDAMLNERFGEIAQRPGAPFLGAYSAQGRLIRSKEVYALSALVSDGGIARGLAALLTEGERVAQHGFTQTELERAKADFLRGMERAYAERAKTASSDYVDEYVDNYLEGDPIPGVAAEWRLGRALVPGIRLDEVNRLAREWLGGHSRVILASAPAKDSADVPTARALLAVADSVSKAAVAAYDDSTSDAPLIARAPVPGRVTATRRIPELGVTEWTLSNGARVVLKPTNFKDDELLVRAYALGGTSLAADSLLIPARTATAVVSAGGVGSFSATALRKALAGKSVSVEPIIGQYDEGLAGGGSPADAETLFQLIHLYFTAPRADSAAYLAYRSRVKALLANRDADPDAAFSDTLDATLTRHHPRAKPITERALDQMSLARSIDFYRHRFADAGGFTFFFVGNIDTLRLRPLVERYLASLPSTGKRERWRDVGLDYPRGVVKREVHKGTDPKSETAIVFSGPFQYTRHDVYLMSSLQDVLEIRLRDRLRERLGGTYGVSVSASPSHYPRERYEISVEFGSAPGRVDELTRAVFEEIDSLQRVGPTAQDLAKVKETQLRERETGLRRNGVWLSLLYAYDYNGWDPREILAYPADVRRLDAAAIRGAARRWLDRDNVVQVSLMPENPVSGRSK
ncbi:MAG TPA: insulinase family protein [Gemmatimonadaceae bacterium]|nr:insulinase family protein [Gemmatimonadaceae bacterium]